MNNYLLTFMYEGYSCYSWFEDEEEMNNYIRYRGEEIEVTEKIRIIDAVEI